MASKITYFLLITLLLTLGFGQLLRFEYSGLTIYFHDFIVITILAINLKHFPSIRPQLSTLRLFLLSLIFSWIVALTLYSPLSLMVPFFYTLRLLAYLTLYLLLIVKKTQLSHSYFVLTSAVMIIVGLLQYYYLPDMRWAQYLGWDDHLHRLTLPHFDPTFTGALLVLALLTNYRFFSLSTPIYVLPIFLTYARSIWISLFITFLFFVRPLKYLLVILFLFSLAIYSLPQRFGEGTNLFRTYSISSRFNTDLSYIKKYQGTLIFGRGLNTLMLDQPSHILPNHSIGPNNSYLYLLSTTGILGLVGWLIFIQNLYVNSSHKPLLIFFFVASIFNNVMFYPFALLWVLLVESLKAPTSA